MYFRLWKGIAGLFIIIWFKFYHVDSIFFVYNLQVSVCNKSYLSFIQTSPRSLFRKIQEVAIVTSLVFALFLVNKASKKSDFFFTISSVVKEDTFYFHRKYLLTILSRYHSFKRVTMFSSTYLCSVTGQIFNNLAW